MKNILAQILLSAGMTSVLFFGMSAIFYGTLLAVFPEGSKIQSDCFISAMLCFVATFFSGGFVMLGDTLAE